MARLRDASVDLLLGGRCVGCARPGRLLCLACGSALPARDDVHRVHPTAGGRAPTFAVAPYDALVREVVLGHKERRLHGLRPVLGALLAGAVGAALAQVDAAVPVVLVPVPSRASTVRARGHDATLSMTRDAAVRLSRDPRLATVDVARLLRLRPGVRDQAGLDAEQRHANLAGSMAASSRHVRALHQRHPVVHLVVCDDVVTTGSTAVEAQRALAATGLRVLAVAAVAATPRRGAGDR